MINRKEVVSRHNPHITNVDPLSPLSVGNGEFAFTSDFTGLQTFPDEYKVPLGTQSQWGWHYTEHDDVYQLEDLELQQFSVKGREVGYPLYPAGHDDAYHWLRQNPHRLQLGQLSFRFIKENNQIAEVSDITAINQSLDLWSGILYSHFSIENQPVSVITVCHPNHDQLGVKVVSPLLEAGRLQIVLRFPAPDMTSRIWEESTKINWGSTERHQTELYAETEKSMVLKRIMDQDQHFVQCSWNEGGMKRTECHEYTWSPANKTKELCFSLCFSPELKDMNSYDEVQVASEKHWASFWSDGGIIDFSESSDSRALELERRVVLSQFLTALHCSGSIPPQETGYMYNSWFGKFHLEMHWWHAAHFPLWGRGHLLEKSLDWYVSILPLAKELASNQGYEGVRWPKMIGIDGKQSPSPIAPALIWQQPHPISLAELCYKENPSEDTLVVWKDIVIETANFMVSYVEWDEQKKAYILGPPLIPAQECHKPEDSYNPPYELEYWRYGLATAIQWVERLNEPVNPKWKEVVSALAEPPHHEGVYLAHEGCPETFEKYNHDHPSMLGALGILPGKLIDPIIMKKTLERVQKEWQWETVWGWDFPLCAMTAARLGEAESAVDFLLMDETKNTYLANGHNYQSPALTAYLPGNGGLLTAVSMMASGWNGSPNQQAPGFPQDGSWVVKAEGLKQLL